MLDQDLILISRMKAMSNFFDAMSGFKAAAGQTTLWSKANPQAWTLVETILDLRASTGWSLS